MIVRLDPDLSIRRQCRLIGLNRSTFYYQPAAESPLNLQLMRLIDAQYTRTPFVAAKAHQVYPYLLRGLRICRPNHVWCADITYVPMPQGFMYLVAIMDWFSRYVITWQLSNSLDGRFCLDALDLALKKGKPDIFNTVQGSQFTAQPFVGCLETAGVRVSMDGRGRVMDNIFVERLWRTVKYEDIYLKEYATGPSLENGLRSYFTFYNDERPH